jgi:Putative adhesin
MQSRLVGFVAVGFFAASVPAMAQRQPFERAIDVSAPSTLDVSTIRGKIDVRGGAPGKIVVSGLVTVRTGLALPSDAVEIMRRVAEHPPIEVVGNTVRLRPPSDEEARRAVTVSYEVKVPPDAQILTLSDSGATTVSGVGGSVDVSTQSGAIALSRLGSTVRVKTGSGAVNVDEVAAALSVTTSSSAITARGLQGSATLRTQSGAVDAALTGDGDVEVQTGSSAITVCGASGGVSAITNSGHISIEGKPARPWSASTGSGSMAIGIDPKAAVALNVSSRSGKVRLDTGPVQGTVSERRVDGTIGGGGPLVRAESRSGSIDVVSDPRRACP